MPKSAELPLPLERMRTEFHPGIVVIAGPTLSGKTTLGENIARASNFTHLDADGYRAKIVGALGKDPAQRLDMDTYEVPIQRFAYRRMHALARIHALNGLPVVLTGSYSQPAYRENLQKLLESVAVPSKIFMLNTPSGELETRLAERIRLHDSESTVKDLREVQRQAERYQEMTEFSFTRIDTAGRFQGTITRDVLNQLLFLSKQKTKGASYSLSPK